APGHAGESAQHAIDPVAAGAGHQADIEGVSLGHGDGAPRRMVGGESREKFGRESRVNTPRPWQAWPGMSGCQRAASLTSPSGCSRAKRCDMSLDNWRKRCREAPAKAGAAFGMSMARGSRGWFLTRNS